MSFLQAHVNIAPLSSKQRAGTMGILQLCGH